MCIITRVVVPAKFSGAGKILIENCGLRGAEGAA